jgi:ABC-2 type transport system permease protein
MRRHLRILLASLRASLQVSMQYRVDFLIGCAMAVFWMVWNLVPAVVVWGARPAIAGWTFPEALLVLAWFAFLRGVLEGAVHPSLVAVIDHIRTGTLDFVLLKPADAQFLVSTQRCEVARVTDLAGAAALAAYALHEIGRMPAPADVAVALALSLAAAVILYSLAILVIAAAFFVVRVDNLIYLFSSVFDAARWPATVFRGFWRILLTFVIPLALMTTYPAMALLGRLQARTALGALAGAAAFALVARVVWRRAIRHYTSASS